ncbi:MAG TPA: hypothetical protein VMY76_09110 [Gemmatimonadales bacterium]|nr:hypothetical protein [Gemmatimonadales bacterium]
MTALFAGWQQPSGVQAAAPPTGIGSGSPTVGDTIWVGRTVSLPAGATLRPADWDAPEPIERLGPPRVTPRGDSVDVSYPIVIWRTGPLAVELPGPLRLGAGGTIDSLPPLTLSLVVRSVLPSASIDSAIAPQPRAEFVPRSSTSIGPLLVLLAASALLLAPLYWWWRRRGPPRPRPALPIAPVTRAPLERWADAGETRAVAAAATTRLRDLIAARIPAAHPGLDTEHLLGAVAVRSDWPLAELGDLLRSLDEARFGDRAFPDAIGLARWADELAPRLVAEAA